MWTKLCRGGDTKILQHISFFQRLMQIWAISLHNWFTWLKAELQSTESRKQRYLWAVPLNPSILSKPHWWYGKVSTIRGLTKDMWPSSRRTLRCLYSTVAWIALYVSYVALNCFLSKSQMENKILWVEAVSLPACSRASASQEEWVCMHDLIHLGPGWPACRCRALPAAAGPAQKPVCRCSDSAVLLPGARIVWVQIKMQKSCFPPSPPMVLPVTPQMTSVTEHKQTGVKGTKCSATSLLVE